MAHLGDMGFWFESFQNWQSEFLATAALVVLSIVLRFRGSPEVEACECQQCRDRALDVAAESTLRDEPLPPTTTHLCVDMQRLFGPGTDWALAWMPRVLPRIVRLCELGS